MSRAELRGLTDRQAWEQYVRPARDREERSRRRGGRGDGGGPQTFGGEKDDGTDPDIPGFRWKAGRPAGPDAEVEVNGAPADGEDVLRNMARAGAFGPGGMKKVEAVIAQKRAAEAEAAKAKGG